MMFATVLCTRIRNYPSLFSGSTKPRRDYENTLVLQALHGQYGCGGADHT